MELPAGGVVLALFVVGEVVVAQDDAGATGLRFEGDDHACAAGGTGGPPVQPQVNTSRCGGSTSRNCPTVSTPSRIRTREVPPGTGSRSASLPIHCTQRAGSVK